MQLYVFFKRLLRNWTGKASRWLGLGVAVVVIPLGASWAGSLLPRVGMDDRTGYAIGGYDPVDYFVLGESRLIENGIEAYWGGVSWKFRNIGNKQAFLLHPCTYAPRFGGLDPVLLSQHKGVMGSPSLFDIYKDRLYLFYNGTTLARWKKYREGIVSEAKLGWPKVARESELDPGPPAKQAAGEDQGPLDQCEPARWSGQQKR